MIVFLRDLFFPLFTFFSIFAAGTLSVHCPSEGNVRAKSCSTTGESPLVWLGRMERLNEERTTNVRPLKDSCSRNSNVSAPRSHTSTIFRSDGNVCVPRTHSRL